LLKKLLGKIFGDKQKKNIRELEPYVEEINREFEGLSDLSEEELKARTDLFRRRLARGETIDDIMSEAFATVKETCRRLLGTSWKVTGSDEEWNMVPFDVQLMGAVALHQGRIAEMATGEGKTLVAVMPMYLNALELNPDWVRRAGEEWGDDPGDWTFESIEGIPVGLGAHLVTVNDYLARRDAQWMGPVYEYLGLTVGCIQGGMDPEQRRKQYNCDITYGTNNEFGFDYLRDNMARSMEQRVQREHHYAIVDEVDSVLIDEARTPLIISGPVPRSQHRYKEYRGDVSRLVQKQTVMVNHIVSEADELWEQGDLHAAATLYLKAKRGAPKNKRLMRSLQDPDRLRELQRVEAERLRDKNLHELDEDLLFSIDEREKSVAMSDKGRRLLSPNDPDFFLLQDIGDVMAEIEDKDVGEEEKLILRKKAYEEHSKRAEALHNIDQLLRAFQMYEKDVEYVVKDGRVMIVDQFTGRLMPGRRFSDGLHEALEAKENVEIRSETQTMATITIQNYFRMYDKLAGMTGTAETEETEFQSIYDLDVVVVPTNRPVVREDHEDRVYKTKREKYNAIIAEIERLHRRGQPVLVGTVSVDVSEVLSRILRARKIPHSVLNAKHHEKEAEIVARAGQPGAVTIATNMAGRGTDIKLAPKVKEVTDEDGEKVPGGLFVIGTARHESRRIDRQLRGRSGRQGDPGASRFYLSLEDDLFRLFASEKMLDFLKKSGKEEGEIIEHPMLTKAIQRAQLERGDRVIVIGVGGVGQYLAQELKALGAGTVLAVDINEDRLQSMQSYGVDGVVNARDKTPKDVANEVKAYRKQHGLPAHGWKIFESSGTKPGQETALALLSFTGKLVIVGFGAHKVDYMLSRVMAFDAEIIGTWGCLPEYYPQVLDLVLSKQIILEDFVQTRPMSEIAEAFAEAHATPPEKRIILTPDF